MTEAISTTDLRYSLVKYRNAPTQEDINFGVLVHDLADNRCVAKWDVDGAVQRASAVFPGFDGSVRFVLEVAAREFAHQVERHAAEGGLDWLADHHRFCIRVSPPREIQGDDPSAEARQLAAALIPPPVWTAPVSQTATELADEGASAAAVFALGVLHARGEPVPATEIVAAAGRLNAPFDEEALLAACDELQAAGFVERRDDDCLVPKR